MVRNWLKEPLVQFLLAGLAIYLFFVWRGEEVDPASRSIQITRETQAQIAWGFEQLMGRAPTDLELEGQIERYIREEVLYREALREGLDRDDAVVRRRMAKKMDLIASAQAEVAEPSDTTLQEWYAAHPERFATQARYSFDQIYFEQKTQAARQLSAVSGSQDWRKEGEEISLPPSARAMPRKEVRDRFGELFLAALDDADASEEWQGPVPSGFGWHLVRLNRRDMGAVPPLSDIREKVVADWRSATIESRKQEAYRILREAYSVEIAQ